MNITKFILTTLSLFLLLVALVSGIILFSGDNFEEKGSKVDCYDKHASKIVGETCLSNSAVIKEEAEPLLLLFLTGIFFTFFLTIIRPLLDWSDEATDFFGFEIKNEEYQYE